MSCIKKVAWVAIVAALLWLSVAILVPLISAALWEEVYYNSRLIEIHTVGRFTAGELTIISYHTSNMLGGGEFVLEHKLFGKDISVSTQRQGNGTYKIYKVSIGNVIYESHYLESQPEVLQTAQHVLELGRKRFAEIQK